MNGSGSWNRCGTEYFFPAASRRAGIDALNLPGGAGSWLTWASISSNWLFEWKGARPASISYPNKHAAGEWKRRHQPVRLLRWVARFHAWQRG